MLPQLIRDHVFYGNFTFRYESLDGYKTKIRPETPSVIVVKDLNRLTFELTPNTTTERFLESAFSTNPKERDPLVELAENRPQIKKEDLFFPALEGETLPQYLERIKKEPLDFLHACGFRMTTNFDEREKLCEEIRQQNDLFYPNVLDFTYLQ